MEALLLKMSEVAQVLGVSRSTVYSMAAMGELPVIRIRGASGSQLRDFGYGWLSK
jgi:excisionase family DNA binding protein